MLQTSIEVKNTIIQTVNSGRFYKRITQWCSKNCEFYNICKRDKRWIDKFKTVKLKLNETFKYFDPDD